MPPGRGMFGSERRSDWPNALGDYRNWRARL